MWEEYLGVSFQHDHLLWARTAHIMLQLQWYDFRWEKGKKNNIFILAATGRQTIVSPIQTFD